MDPLTTIGTVTALLKTVTELANSGNKVELRRAISKLSLELANVETQHAGVITENNELKRQLASVGKDQTEMSYRHGAYFKFGDDVPFCPGCFDSNKKSIRLTKQVGQFVAFGTHQCPHCKQFFNVTGS